MQCIQGGEAASSSLSLSVGTAGTISTSSAGLFKCDVSPCPKVEVEAEVELEVTVYGGVL